MHSELYNVTISQYPLKDISGDLISTIIILSLIIFLTLISILILFVTVTCRRVTVDARNYCLIRI